MKLNLRIFCMCGIMLIITALFTSCKKDYPDDIPQWLKEKIRETKKEADTGECASSGCITISEYSNNQNEIIYRFYNSDSAFISDYDYLGSFLCSNIGGLGPCGSYNLNDFVFVRLIWQEPPQSG